MSGILTEISFRIYSMPSLSMILWIRKRIRLGRSSKFLR
ncbi:hypothetical protein LEP1GSC133_2443 [Leptospira borgpetersenii serovar Pomona str. 200901868]|uniref:Uncharacterized protein n=1 Tax=Leptospira borgpetersenii serovar Pomona str. 200901868 TaxID=1192866 RepID=M6WJG8_LEPBO|nr:hypothetical protein LEP1GSC133_2443 [Leptospira borgpetersenii serovar Pomona str. 200901868]